MELVSGNQPGPVVLVVPTGAVFAIVNVTFGEGDLGWGKASLACHSVAVGPTESAIWPQGAVVLGREGAGCPPRRSCTADKLLSQ